MRHLPSAPGALAACFVFAAAPAFATNGMNLEAYGAKPGGMGGAAFAYNAGNAAVMNNPATLGLVPAEHDDFCFGLGLLAPNVSASHPQAGRTDSDGTAYWMPAISYIRHHWNLSYGVAMLAQGGMGTEYGAGSALFAWGMDSDGNPTALSGQDIRSEVSVGRIMFPLAWSVNDRLAVAAQMDLVWAGMDVRMDMDGQTLVGMMGQGLVSGSLAGGLPAPNPGVVAYDYARFDFSDGNPATGQAKGYGWAYKLGLVYKVTERFNVGATYHPKTNIEDLDASDASMAVSINGTSQTLHGKLKVVDFQWPETIGVGVSYRPDEKWLLAADLRHIRWSDAMKDFRMSFTDAASGNVLNVRMPQNWRDQNVIAVGAQYQLRPHIALRFGMNYAKNPVPDNTLNPLFPAIVEKHYTVGLGYALSAGDSVAVALTYAPEVEATSTVTGITSSHSQVSVRLNYSRQF